MRAALEYLAARAGDRRRVAILGDMAELGRTAPAYHREVGEAAAELEVDELLAVGELARGYVDGAAGVPSRWTPNVHEALRQLDELVRPGRRRACERFAGDGTRGGSGSAGGGEGLTWSGS